MRSEDEFAELLMKSQERLFAYVYSWLHDTADTQDVLQQTSTVLWEKFDTFDRDTDFFRWAVVVAKYQSLNFLRRRRAYRARFSNEFMDSLATEDLLLEDEYEEARKEALQQCISKLSDSDRRLLRSRYRGGLKVNQIADLLGRSTSSISNSFNRIRNALLACVQRAVEKEGRA